MAEPEKKPQTVRVNVKELDDMAYKAIRAGEHEKAYEYCAQLVMIDPKNPNFWKKLGIALRELKHFQASLNCAMRVIELNPADFDQLGNIGNVLSDMGRFDEAMKYHRAVVTRKQKDHGAWYNLGVCARDAGLLGEAADALNKALALVDPDNDPDNYYKYRWNRAVILLALGETEQGWKDYALRDKAKLLIPRQGHLPVWDGKKNIKGKTLILTTEQGFGDTIFISRFIPDLIKKTKAKIKMQVKPELGSLLDEIKELGVEFIDPEEKQEADYRLSIMSVPVIFQVDLKNPPAPVKLRVPEDSREKAKKILAPYKDRFKVGIVWSGSVTFAGNHERATGLDSFIPLMEVPKTQFFSLQKGPREVELTEQRARGLVVDLAPCLETFCDTAAFCEELDLVMMTDTSVAHVAGALNRPIWNILHYSPYWLYGWGTSETPWYPSMRLFRQPKLYDWDSVFVQVKEALVQEVNKHFYEPNY